MLRESMNRRRRRAIWIALSVGAALVVAVGLWTHERNGAVADGPLITNDELDDTVGQGHVAAGGTVTYGYIVLTNTARRDVHLLSASLHFDAPDGALSVGPAQTLGPARSAYQWPVYNSWPPPDLGTPLVPLAGATVKPSSGDGDLDTEVLFPVHVDVAGDYRADRAEIVYEVDGVRHVVRSHTVVLICQTDCKRP
jgi:hypothetical protein